ncbi:MAG TPA: hypothetical protein PLU37_13820 [Chitinophagaceae bacterium]|nr:hypothetical protein [Chitinophagales bacterium]HPG12604.1 hypothetical protein [Chitinophagaceae bacterium]
MKEQIFKASRKKIISQTILIWVSVIMHILVIIWTLPVVIKGNQIAAFLFANTFFSFLSIPSVVIFFRYYNHSINKKFVITYNKLRFEDEKTGYVIELNTHEIIEIKLIQNHNNSKLPWCDLEYFSFTNETGKKIIVTSFFMPIYEFWMCTLARKVSSKKLKIKEVLYPIFKSLS